MTMTTTTTAAKVCFETIFALSPNAGELLFQSMELMRIKLAEQTKANFNLIGAVQGGFITHFIDPKAYPVMAASLQTPLPEGEDVFIMLAEDNSRAILFNIDCGDVLPITGLSGKDLDGFLKCFEVFFLEAHKSLF